MFSERSRLRAETHISRRLSIATRRDFSLDGSVHVSSRRQRFSFSVSRRAELDLLDIATFTLERWGSAQMERYLRELDQRLGFLTKHPNAGQSNSEARG